MEENEEVRGLDDEELIARYREMKADGSGDDPRLVPPEYGLGRALRRELERRGLAPDREDVIPPNDGDEGEEPEVRDQA